MNDGGPAKGRATTTTTTVDSANASALVDRRADARLFLDACYHDRQGKAFTPIGRGPHWTADGKYKHTAFIGKLSVDYPGGDIDGHLDRLLTESETADVHVSPNLMYLERVPGSAVGAMAIYADWDGDRADAPAVLEKVGELDGFVVDSGTPGHLHAYVLLSEPVHSATATALCKAFQAYLPPGSDPGKHAINDLLRLPGTNNHKSVAETGRPNPVQFLIRPGNRRWNPHELADTLGVALRDAIARPQVAATPMRSTLPEPVDLTRVPGVQAELGRISGDRSADIYRVLSACRSAGLTFNEASNVVGGRADLAAKLTECGGDDLSRIWIKLCDEQQRLELPDPNASPDPTGGTDETTTAPAMPRIWRATDLEHAAPPRWLATNRVPYASVTLVVGEEGIGKSLLWVWIIAAVTTGSALPEFGIPARAPQLVVIVVTEDDWKTTVLPRMTVAGVNLDMVRVICTDRDGSGSPVFPRDLYLIADAAESGEKAALVVVDAWLDTVPAALSVRDPQQARQALHPFKELASRTDCAVLLLCHTNRVATPNARDRYGATGELRKKARMTLFAQADEDGCLLIGPEKMNTAKPIPASKFTITGVQHFPPTEDHDGTVPLLSYLGETDQTAREHLADAYAADRETGGDPGDVLAWLAAELATGPRWAADIQMAAEWAGHSAAKLKRAKRTLHVTSTREGPNGPWFWKLAHHKGIPGDAQGSSRDPWTSGTSGLLAGDASTSQDAQRMNGETRRPLGPVGNIYGELCECGKWPARLDTGYCEWCTANKRRTL